MFLENVIKVFEKILVRKEMERGGEHKRFVEKCQ